MLFQMPCESCIHRRTGSFSWLTVLLIYRASSCILVRRDYSSDVPAPRPSKYVYPPPMRKFTLRERAAVWDAANKLYFGPDRDFANFPSLVRPESIPPVRLGFIPDSWFQMFYEKTGVTGMQLLNIVSYAPES